VVRWPAWLRDEDEAVVAAPEPSNEAEFQNVIHAAYIEVQKAKLDRTNAAATFVTTAAGTIGTIYAGLLALAFSVESTPARPLPPRALAPAIFLALAFVFSVVRTGFVRRTGRYLASQHPAQLPANGRPPVGDESSPPLINPASTWEEQELRLVAFMNWIDRGALKQAWALRVAVICLGAAVFLLPLPFVDLSSRAATLMILAVAMVVLAFLIYEFIAAVLKVIAAVKARTRAGLSTPSSPAPDVPAPDAPPGKRT
jgi:hypothetical protein